tara:strand:- start:965 stop:1489 length:525 start_codon:yes stop_codon:yes gene_type:complete
MSVYRFLVLLGFISGCGGLSVVPEQKISIEMYAANETPETAASGDTSPIYQSYTLLNVSFLSQDGSEVVTLFEGDGSRSYKVVTRPQIVYSKDISLYNGEEFSAISVGFATTVTGASSEQENLSMNLSDPLELYSAVTVEEGKGIDVLIRLKWKNTISGSTMELPQYVLSWSAK